MHENKNAEFLIKELESEYASTRKCIERVPQSLFSYKPHSTSMAMGDLTGLVAEIPKWISTIAEQPELDLATYPHDKHETTDELVNHFEVNYKQAQESLNELTDEKLLTIFSLKGNGKILTQTSRLDQLLSTLNHWVHHRGQLTVYMRMNGIEIPSIYGPSKDENPFK